MIRPENLQFVRQWPMARFIALSTTQQDKAGQKLVRLKRLVLAVLLLSPMPGISATTQYAGGDKGSQYAIDLDCAHDQVMTGMVVNFSTSRIGKVKAVCRKIHPNGQWQGNDIRTGWSQTNVSGSYKNTKLLSCPADHAVHGFRARTTDYGSAIAINALKVYCRQLTQGGALTGAAVNLGWVGGSGTQTDIKHCVSNEPARGILGRSKTYLHKIAFDCKKPQLPVGSSKTSFKGNAIWHQTADANSPTYSISTVDLVLDGYPGAQSGTGSYSEKTALVRFIRSEKAACRVGGHRYQLFYDRRSERVNARAVNWQKLADGRISLSNVGFADLDHINGVGTIATLSGSTLSAAFHSKYVAMDRKGNRITSPKTETTECSTAKALEMLVQSLTFQPWTIEPLLMPKPVLVELSLQQLGN